MSRIMHLVTVLFFLGLSSFTYGLAAGTEWEKVIDLKGFWKFSVGDNKIWADTYYNDKHWEKVYVPSGWENEGFRNYDGYAWYRTTFEGKELKDNSTLYNLFLGYIDDVDEVYINGKKIGNTGSFSPNYHTAYNIFRNYNIPGEYINFTGRNVIAVRVFDEGQHGGIVSGDVGIYTARDERGLSVNLRGGWDFKITGRKYTPEGFDRNLIASLESDEMGEWTSVSVPDMWEHQGYSNYDGSGWYRKKFIIPHHLVHQDLVLLVGKIDDTDQTYLNGKLIGSNHEQYNKLRVYPLSSKDLKAGELNTLIIYVHDSGGNGGIYEGPVGIMKQSDFTQYIRWR